MAKKEITESVKGYYTINEIAKIMGKNRMSVYNLCKKYGVIAPTAKAGKSLLFDKEEIDKLLHEDDSIVTMQEAKAKYGISVFKFWRTGEVKKLKGLRKATYYTIPVDVAINL